MNWLIILLVVLVVWYFYPEEVREHFPSSIYDMVWIDRPNRPQFDRTLKWNIYQEGLFDCQKKSNLSRQNKGIHFQLFVVIHV